MLIVEDFGQVLVGVGPYRMLRKDARRAVKAGSQTPAERGKQS
jgi:hypothetical protein